VSESGKRTVSSKTLQIVKPNDNRQSVFQGGLGLDRVRVRDEEAPGKSSADPKAGRVYPSAADPRDVDTADFAQVVTIGAQGRECVGDRLTGDWRDADDIVSWTGSASSSG